MHSSIYPLIPLFSLDGSASLLVKHSSFWRSHKDFFLVPIEITDNGDPPLSSTDTLTVSLCHCEAGGEVLNCHMTTGSAAGLSTPALLAILACAFSLLGNYTIISSFISKAPFTGGHYQLHARDLTGAERNSRLTAPAANWLESLRCFLHVTGSSPIFKCTWGA